MTTKRMGLKRAYTIAETLEMAQDTELFARGEPPS
jgi:hypothetical protein